MHDAQEIQVKLLDATRKLIELLKIVSLDLSKIDENWESVYWVTEHEFDYWRDRYMHKTTVQPNYPNKV